MLNAKSLLLFNNKSFNNKSTWLSKPKPGHLVQFYRSSDNLLAQLGEFVGCGLRSGDNCLIIATPDHLEGLNNELKKHGHGINRAQQTGRFVVLDAKETLNQIMVNNLPDRNQFFQVIGSLVENFVQTNKPIRAFGEMVALLWQSGNKEAVLALENLWNELAEIYQFSLFCAYPELHFIMDRDMPDEIHKCHNVDLLDLVAR